MTAPVRRRARESAAKRRVLIVDDHPIMRQGLRELIEAEPDLEVCAEAETEFDALKAARARRPDLAVVDIALKEDSGLSLVRALRARHPKLAILVLSMFDEQLYGPRALNAGARGYIMKEEAPEKLLVAIRRVLGGGLYLSERARSSLRSEKDLSDREVQVLGLIGKGFASKDIAAELHLSIKTIETYRAHIKKKLGLRTSTDLRRRALAWVQAEYAR